MAANLGTLTLDLIAKTGNFIAPLEKAARDAQKRMGEIKKAADVAGKAIGAASVVAAGAMAVWIKSSINQAAEIENLARVAGSSTTEFQRFAVGAKTVGIENDKLSDILKDVNDKVGDFLVTGGGPMADFFEKVAPLVGVTADQFRGLSGPDALGLYVDTLEKAGASEQELTFFMEAIASDATALIPLLKDSGREMGILADEAQGLGLILSDETVKGAKQFNSDLALLGKVANGVGQQIAADLLPELTNLTNELRDPETIKAAADMAKAVVGSFTSIIDGARNTVQFIQWAADSAAAFMGGIAADDIVRLNDEIERLEGMKASGALDRLVFFGRDGMVSYYNDEELDSELAKIRAAVEVAMQKGGPIVLPVVPQLKTTAPGLGLPSKEEEEAAKAAAKAAEKAAAAAAKEANRAIADAERHAAAIDGQVKALQLQVRTLGMTADEEKLFRLELEGATKAQLAQAAASLQTVDAFEQQKKTQEDYKDLVADLRTEEEKRTDGLYEQLKVLDAMQGLSGVERGSVVGRIASGATEEAPDFGGLDPTVGGIGGEIDKLDAAEKELEQWYDTQLEMLAGHREKRADLASEWDEQEATIKQQHEDRLTQIERARQRTTLAVAGEIFGNLAVLAQSENKKMVAIGKAAAIAQATISGFQAVQNALAVPPYPLGVALAVTAGVATAANIASIAGVGFKSGGYTGDGSPNEVAGDVHRGEFVFDAAATDRLGVGNLEAMRSGKLDRTLRSAQAQHGGGSGGVSDQRPIQITVNMPGITDARQARQSEASTRRAIARGVAQSGRYN